VPFGSGLAVGMASAALTMIDNRAGEGPLIRPFPADCGQLRRIRTAHGAVRKRLRRNGELGRRYIRRQQADRQEQNRSTHSSTVCANVAYYDGTNGKASPGLLVLSGRGFR
jgi:hypothetical protein